MADRRHEKSIGMLCPICGYATQVFDSRGDGEAIQRRRKCLKCQNKFSTIEIDADLYQEGRNNFAGRPLTQEEITALKLFQAIPKDQKETVLDMIRIAAKLVR